jgi:sirohydrochlorin cobaltochelatase
MPTTQSENNWDWGALLVGHGTRNAAGRAEFLKTAATMAELLPHLALEPCFLELAAPGIATAVERLVRRRVKGICVMPLMLLAAGHVKRDIPAAVTEAVNKLGGLPTTQAPHLGCHKRLLELSAKRYQEALAGRPQVAVENTLLIMVGRGSRDPEAVDEMRRFVRLRREITPVGGVETCFAAMADPSLNQTLATATRGPFRHVVVQPHLLFEGSLLARVRAQVESVAGNSPAVTCSVAGHLGASPLLAEAAGRIIVNRLAGHSEQLT